MKIIENRKYFYLLSVLLIAIGVVMIIVNIARDKGAFNYDVEFSGGTSFTVEMGRDFNNDEIANIVTDVTGQSAPQVQRIMGTTQVLVKVRSLDQEVRAQLVDRLMEEFDIAIEDISYSDVSATISSEMQQAAVSALFVACLVMLIYISIRFRDVLLGASAIIALFHDALIVIGVYAVFRIPLNYSFIAVILTVVGYSINSAIIIFDRVRENKRLNHKLDHHTLVNSSVMQTIRRTVYTTVSTMLVMICLYIMGVPSIKEFTLPIIVGICVGAYSSICISGPLWFQLSLAFGKKKAK